MSVEAQRAFLSAATLLMLVFVCSASGMAQNPQPQPTPLTAPPPLKLIPAQERQQLDQTKDIKQRLRVTMELATAHLTRAEQLTNESKYDAASSEVGTYNALIENVLDALSSLRRDSDKARDLYKKLEMALRADGPRLTAMRRITPLEFAVWIKKVEDFARNARTEALNSFYGHTVVRDADKRAADKPEEKPKETPTPKSN
jgi:hypothetical protein